MKLTEDQVTFLERMLNLFEWEHFDRLLKLVKLNRKREKRLK